MTTRLQRSAPAIDQRINMSSTKQTFVYVEGMDIDRAYYDELFSTLPVREDVKINIRRANEVKVGSHGDSGGKSVALAARAEISDRGLLADDPETGAPRYLFIVDRDFILPGKPEATKSYLIYTYCCDVEGDLYYNTNLPRALSHAFFISQSELQIHLDPYWDPISIVGEQLEPFLKAIAATVDLGNPQGFRYADVKYVSTAQGLMVDTSFIANLMRSLDENTESHLEDPEFKSSYDTTIANGQLYRIVKGKWISRYVSQVTANLKGSIALKPNVKVDTIATAALGSLNFRESTICYYKNRLKMYSLIYAD